MAAAVELARPGCQRATVLGREESRASALQEPSQRPGAVARAGTSPPMTAMGMGWAQDSSQGPYSQRLESDGEPSDKWAQGCRLKDLPLEQLIALRSEQVSYVFGETDMLTAYSHLGWIQDAAQVQQCKDIQCGVQYGASVHRRDGQKNRVRPPHCPSKAKVRE